MAPSLCLSLASNIRCTGLSRNQDISLLVPPGVELIFGLALAKLRWGGDRNRWLLVVEGVIFFALAVADFLLHENARNGFDLSSFEVYDKALGVFSFLPLSLYAGYLFLLSRKDLLPLASTRRVKLIAQWSLVSLIPPLVIFNELASLNGIAYGLSGRHILIGYSSSSARTVSLFFSSATLVLLGSLELMVACGCAFYILRARLRGHGGGVIGGFAWVTVGLLLGALGTFMGFSASCFALVFARRLLRALSRAAVVVGVILGTSAEEGFALFPTMHQATFGLIKEKRTAPPRIIISHPQPGSFQHVSSNVNSFYAIRSDHQQNPIVLPTSINPFDHSTRYIFDQADPFTAIENVPARRGPIENIPVNQKGPIGSTRNARGFQPFTAEQAHMVDLYSVRSNPGDRVTIQFPIQGSAPVLEMRFSCLQMPSPGTLMAAVRTPEPSEIDEDEGQRLVSSYGQTLQPPQNALQMASLRKVLKSADRRSKAAGQGAGTSRPWATGLSYSLKTTEGSNTTLRQYPRSRRESNASLESRASGSIAAMRDLVSRLPGWQTKGGSSRRDRSSFRPIEEITKPKGSPLAMSSSSQYSNTSMKGRGSHATSSQNSAEEHPSLSRQDSLPIVHEDDNTPTPTPPLSAIRSYHVAETGGPGIRPTQVREDRAGTGYGLASRWSSASPSTLGGSPIGAGNGQRLVPPQQSRWSDSSEARSPLPQPAVPHLPTEHDGNSLTISYRRSAMSMLDTPVSAEHGQIMQATRTVVQGPSPHWSITYARAERTPTPRHPNLPINLTASNENLNPFESDVYSTEAGHTSESRRSLPDDIADSSSVRNIGTARARSSTPQYVEGFERESLAVEHDHTPYQYHMPGFQFPLSEEEEQTSSEPGRREGLRIPRFDSAVLGEEDIDMIRGSAQFQTGLAR